MSAPRQRRAVSPAVHAPKQGLRPDEAADVIGSVSVFRAMVQDGWLSPVFRSNNVTLYAYTHVQGAFGRLVAGEVPPSLSP